MSVARLPHIAGSAKRLSWNTALVGALGAAVGLALLYGFAFRIRIGARFDTEALISFWTLRRPGMVTAANAVISTVTPVSLVLLAVILAIFAGRSRRPVLILVVVLILGGANLSAEALKSLTPVHSAVVVGWLVSAPGVFPSGHAAASMSLVLCAVVVSSGRARSIVAALGTLYAVLVGYSLLVLGVHYPSDVLAGFLVAALWALLAIAAARAAGVFRSEAVEVRMSGPDVITPVAWALALSTAGTALSIVVVSPGGRGLTLAVAATVIGALAATIILIVAGALPSRYRAQAQPTA